jgi:fatty-acyl-CoA synthase/long-chain acyl-CoA synthetase
MTRVISSLREDSNTMAKKAKQTSKVKARPAVRAASAKGPAPVVKKSSIGKTTKRKASRGHRATGKKAAARAAAIKPPAKKPGGKRAPDPEPAGKPARPRAKAPSTFVPYAGEDLTRARISVTTMGDLLLMAADRYPDTLALVFPDAEITYAQLAQRALRRARSLQAMGVRPRDHVGILMHTCAEFMEIFFAAAFCGAVIVPINARYKASELAYVIENGDIVTVITTDAVADSVDFVERLNIAMPDLAKNRNPRSLKVTAAPKLRNVILLGKSQAPGFVSNREFDTAGESRTDLQVHETRLRVRLRDVGLMLYTSGTTANPKGCLITHEAMVRNSIALGRHRYRLTHDDRFWSPLPMFHIAAVLPMLAIFDVGGTYLTMGYFDPGVALRMLQKYRVTALYPSFVTIMQGLIYHPDFPDTDLSSVKLMNSNFAVQPPGVADPIMKAMPQALQVGSFGMTEAAGTVCTGAWDEPESRRITRLGRPLPGLEVRIVNPETGEDVVLGLRGEVLVRGYSLFDGYYKDAEKTAQALDRDGWFHTGDIGSLDDDGTIMFHGRFKDMLKVGGENVAAAEIEGLLGRHPAVKLAQVVGIPDPKYMEVPAAFVELRPNMKASERELVDFCRREIASFKVPRVVRFVTEWPMSSSKIQKFRLRTALVEELGLE